jgi:hypothetical protein
MNTRTWSARIGLLLLACAAASLPLQAQVYKWVDEKGVTHYSESPPDDKKDKVKKVDTTAPTGFGVSNAKGPKSVQDMETDFKQRRVARQEEEQKQAKAAEQARKESTKKCNQAKQTLIEMAHNGGVYEFNDKNEKVYLTDEQRQALAATAQADVERYCK